MAYGDYDGPNKSDKGQEGGSCNRTRCQASPAIWWNHGSRSWYCADCRRELENDPVNKRHWRDLNFGHPMFENREMMDANSIKDSKMDPSDEELEAAFLLAKLEDLGYEGMKISKPVWVNATSKDVFNSFKENGEVAFVCYRREGINPGYKELPSITIILSANAPLIRYKAANCEQSRKDMDEAIATYLD